MSEPHDVLRQMIKDEGIDKIIAILIDLCKHYSEDERNCNSIIWYGISTRLIQILDYINKSLKA